MNNLLVSVIIPVYNVEKYLERCLISILEQSYSNLEIVIVNDCSTDNSAKICERYKERDGRIIYVSNEKNIGISSTRNVGLSQSHGNFVMFVDSDDFIAFNTIEVMCKQVYENNADFVSCGFLYYHGNESLSVDSNIEFVNLSNSNAFSRLLTDKTNYCAVWAKLIKRNLIEGLSFPEGNRFGEDMAYTPLLIIRAKKIFHTTACLYYYSQEGVSLVRSKFNPDRLYMIEMNEKWIFLCKEHYPELEKMAFDYYVYTMISICTLTLGSENEKYYKEVRTKLVRKGWKYLLNGEVSVKEKIKYLMVALIPRNIHRELRKLMGLKS